MTSGQMMPTNHEQLQELDETLETMYEQRRRWLWASSVVFFAIITLMFAWEWIDHFESKTAWWFIVSCMLLLSINWWYWTMRVIRILLNNQSKNYGILLSMLDDLEAMKADVRVIREHNAPK